MKRWLWLVLLSMASGLALGEGVVAKEIVVYKSPYCGCCSKWVTHLEQNGYSVVTHDVQNMTPVKEQYGIAKPLASCHTAVVDGYVIEGHVPADEIDTLLQQRPEIHGLSVPGMPVGTPGMEHGNHQDDYDVVAIKKDGSTYVYKEHRK